MADGVTWRRTSNNTMPPQPTIHAYMERHHIRELFEELMNKILRDMPEEPLVYLLRAVYKKAGMEIPQGIRYGGLRKSTSDLYKNTSPERRARSAVVSSSVDMAATRSKTLSPIRAAKLKDGSKNTKQKPYWNPDTKTKSSFDELWEESTAARKEKLSAVKKPGTRQQVTSSSGAWASVGLGEDGETFTSPAFTGKGNNQASNKLSEAELLAMENVARSRRSEAGFEPSSVPGMSTKKFGHSRKMESTKHKQELGQLLSTSEHKLTDSGIGLDHFKDDDNNNNDALELLENGDDLKREGVKHIPEAGYKLSRNVRYRDNEPPVKLSINAYAYPSETVVRYSTPETDRFSSDLDEEEEFESVSQVTGPRPPIWNVPESSESDSMPLHPSFTASRGQVFDWQHGNPLARSQQVKTSVKTVGQPLEMAEDLSAEGRTWTIGEKPTLFDIAPDAVQSSRTLQSLNASSGWRLPEDTDAASGYEWNQRKKMLSWLILCLVLTCCCLPVMR